MRNKTPIKTETSKERVVIYLEPHTARRLKIQKAATDKSMSLIVEELLDREFKSLPPLIMA